MFLTVHFFQLHFADVSELIYKRQSQRFWQFPHFLRAADPEVHVLPALVALGNLDFPRAPHASVWRLLRENGLRLVCVA